MLANLENQLRQVYRVISNEKDEYVIVVPMKIVNQVLFCSKQLLFGRLKKRRRKKTINKGEVLYVDFI